MRCMTAYWTGTGVPQKKTSLEVVLVLVGMMFPQGFSLVVRVGRRVALVDSLLGRV